MEEIKKSFASDNWSGVCPEIMTALNEANTGHNPAYGEGDDKITDAAINKFKEHFGEDIAVYFVYNGTAANVLGINQLMKSHHAIVAASTAHINEDECGAPEKFIGSKILQINTVDGKITPDDVKPFLKSIGFQHHAQPKIISISQVTELGSVYSCGEIKALANFAHGNNMYLHMDGARISNAAVTLKKEFREFTTDVGVDVVSFGGTKNGLMFGEAVVFLNKKLSLDFEYARKQGMQLHSKMRFIAAQFNAYLSNNFWKINAIKANNMALKLASEISKFPTLKISQKVDANGVFVLMPTELIPKLQNKYFFHVWNENTKGLLRNNLTTPNISNYKEVRLMCSWDTTNDDINGLIELIASYQ